MTRNSVAQSSTGSSCLRPSSLICLTLFLPVQPRRSDLHPDFFLVRLVERNLLYRSSSSVFFLHSLAFIKQTGQNMQEWYKAAKADKGLNLPPRALSLLRLCEVTPRRDFGSHHCVSGEVNFCQLRPSGAQILLSGSRRHVLGITRAQRTEGRRASPRLVNTVGALSLCHTDTQQVQSSPAVLADAGIHPDWQTYQLSPSSSFMSLPRVFSGCPVLPPSVPSDFIALGITAALFFFFLFLSPTSLLLFFFPFYRLPPSTFSVLLYLAQKKLKLKYKKNKKARFDRAVGFVCRSTADSHADPERVRSKESNHIYGWRS